MNKHEEISEALQHIKDNPSDDAIMDYLSVMKWVGTVDITDINRYKFHLFMSQYIAIYRNMNSYDNLMYKFFDNIHRINHEKLNIVSQIISGIADYIIMIENDLPKLDIDKMTFLNLVYKSTNNMENDLDFTNIEIVDALTGIIEDKLTRSMIQSHMMI